MSKLLAFNKNVYPIVNKIRCNFSTNIKETILEQSLKNVQLHGWTELSIIKAIDTLDLPPLTHRVINRGAPELVEFFLEKKRKIVYNKTLEFMERNKVFYNEINEKDEALESSQNFGLNNDEILLLAVETHFEQIYPYRESWPNALALLASPMEIPYSTKNLFQLVDDLCVFNSIKTSRLDWYTERLFLSAFYVTSELYFITDKSENFIDSRDFIRTNLENFNSLKKSTKSIDNLRDLLFKWITPFR